ncbi:hypothetical protein II906_06045 [bacterium]|nr:hypothetical protein [bacterium]
MTEINNKPYYKAARSALIGGGIGAAIGAAKAPSILGKFDADRFIMDSVYNSAIKDRINKSGTHLTNEAQKLFEACSDCYKKSQETANSIFSKAEEGLISIKHLKALDKDSIFHSEWAEGIKEKAAEFSDDVYLRKETLDEIVTSSHPRYQQTRDSVENFVNKLPKKTGKYAIIGACIGAAALGLFTLYKVGKNSEQK